MSEMEEMQEEIMPVFLITGFLQSGKTQFLKFTMDQEYFQTDAKYTIDRMWKKRERKSMMRLF